MNKFAESNLDIVEGMQRSAAAMAAIGEDWKSSFAIFTGGQEIVQNAEKMGTAIRSFSLRIRGYSENSEDDALELDEDLKNINGDLIDLTKTAQHSQGISVFKDGSTTEFKSLVEYLGQVSDIWDEMSQKQQNDFLQKAFAKTQAQAGAAIIQNFDAVRQSLVEMENAGGSADNEMQIIEQSISYKLNVLKQTWVGTAQSIVDRSDFGVAISGLTKLSEAIGFLVENLGLLGTLAVGGGIFKGLKNIGNIKSWYKDLSSVQTVINEIATTTDIQTIANSISGLSKEQAMLALSTKVLSDEEKQEILVKAGIIASNNEVLLTKAQQVIANTELSASNKLAIKEDLELAASEGMVAKAEVERILSTKMVTDAEREKILSSLGLIEANNAQAASFGLVGKAALSSAKSMLLNPYTLIIAAIGGTIFALTKLADAEKEVGERAKKLSTEFKETKDEIEDYKTKINNLHDVINDNSSSYEEVTDARKNLLSIQDELIEKFGKEEGAISAVTEAIDGQSNALDKLTASQWQEKINKFNKSGFWNDFSNWVHDYDDNIDRMLDKMENTESRINLSDIFNNKEYNEILKDLEGRGYTLNQRGQYYSKDYDTLKDKYNELLEMQNKFKDTQSWLDEEIENDKKTLANNEDIYNQYVLNEKILKNDKLAESWQNVNKAYSEYQDAFTSGEDTTDAVQAYSKALDEAIKNSNGDKSIEEYFKNIYPTIYAEVQKWKFETEIIPTINTDSLKDLTQNDIYKMLETTEVEEGEEVFKSILAYAQNAKIVTGDYNEQVEQLINLLIKLGTIQNDLLNVDKFKVNPVDTTSAKENIQNEYKKIKDWGLEEYSKQIKDGTIQSKFGNIDMDKRTIITWSEELKQTYHDALESWNYDPEIGGIDTVFGGSKRFGEELNGTGWEIAFSPILPDGTFLSWETVNEYINSILEEAYANDGKVTEDELLEFDKEGRQIGNIFVSGIIAAIDDSLEYDNNNNWAEVVGRLMHFSGDFGAVKLAKKNLKETEELNKEANFNWEAWFKKMSIDSDEETKKWNEIANSSESGLEARKKYIEYLKNSQSTFEEVFNSSEFADTKKELLDLAKAGELTSETLTSTDGKNKTAMENYNKLLTETGLTADYLVKRINNLVDATDRLNGVTKNVSSLDTLFKEMKENGFVDIDSLESLGDTWQNLDGFEEFEKIVGDGKHSVEEMSSAFDKLVSEWLNVNNALNKVNESNAELYIKQLENVGISNARTIVEEQLANKFISETNALEGLTEANKAEYIAKLKANNIANAEAIVTNKLTAEKEANDVITKQLGLSTDEFASKSYEAQFSLLDEANASANCRAEIADLRLEEISFNQSGLNVSGRISQLASLAVAYGLVDTAAQQMADREKAMKEYEAKTGAVTGFKYTQADYNHAAEDLTKQIQAQFAKLSDTTVKYTGGKDSSSSSSSSGGSSSKDSSSESTPTKEVFDWIEVKIKRLQTAISEFGETAGNVFKTLAERTKAYGSEISDVTAEIELQQQAYNKYLEKANSIGLSEDYASKVRSGNLSIDEIYDDTLKEQIKDYQTWYEKANDCLNTVNNLQEELTKLNIDNLQLSIDKVNAGLEKTQSKAEKINSKISDEYRRTKASDYNKLDSNYNKQISYYEKLNGYIKQQQSFVEKSSEKWLEFNKTIRENNSSIDELKKNIKENIILRIQLRLDNKKNVFDDIEKQYTKVQDSINLKDANSQYASSKDYNNLNKNIGKQIKNLQSQNKLYKELQKNVQKGSKAWEEYKDSIDDNNSSIRSLTESMVENSKAKAELNNTKASNKVGKVDSADELLKARINNVISYRKQNSYVNSEISNIDKRLAYYNKAVKDNKSGLNSAIKSINNTKSNSKTKSLLQKIKTYIKSKKSIPSNIISSVAKVNPSLANKCTDYNAYLTELEVSRETAKLYKETSKQEKADLAQEKMANIQKYYENRQGVLSQRATQLNSKIDLVQSSGYNVSSKFYDSLIANETKTNKSLANERNKLIKSLSNSIENGNIVKYSDEWYELCQKIDDVTNAQNESTKSLVEYQNALRQLKWDNFDYLETQISNISSEVDFMINQLSRNDLASNDIGGITDEGKAVNVLHASNYTTYTKQANDYKNQITKINKELADDPYNKTLIERKEELIKSYQDCINKAQEEKYAVIDLYTQGYEALKSKISDLISEYEKLLDAEKDAYDYQNNINDKTKQIAQIRKQLEAYANDNSEETKSTVQKLKVSLEDAEKDLKDTQYDKYISSTKDILSDLQDNLSDDIDEIIKNMADNFNQLITAINDNSKSASKIIKDEMKGIGYTSTDEFKSMINTSNIVQSTKQAINDTKEFQQKMLEYADKQYSGTETNTASDKLTQTEGKKSLNNDLEKANSATSAAEKAMQSKLKELENLQNEVNVAEITYKNTKKKYGSKSDKTINAENKYNELQKNYSKLHAEYSASVEDYNNAKLFSDTMKFLGEHLSVSKEARNNLSDLNKVLYDNYGQRILSDSEVDKLAELLNTKSVQTKSGSLYKKLKKMGINGFRVGSPNIPYDQIALVNEAGQELQYDSSQGTIRALGQGDMIFTHEMAQKLWDFASQNPIPLNSSFMSPNRPEFNNTTTNVGDVNINMGGITMNGVNDPEEFTKELNKNLATNPNTIKIMKTNTIGSLSKNYNSLGARSKI